MQDYYIIPLIEEYRKSDPQSEKGVALRRKIAANLGDIPTLRMVLGIDPPEFGDFYPDMKTHTPSTFDTIDSFLDKFGGASNTVPGAYVIEELPPAPLPPAPPRETTSPPHTTQRETEKSQIQDISQLIKNKKYSKAIEIIELENLNNPQKNIYFADQIRFLRKLIAIESYKKQN